MAVLKKKYELSIWNEELDANGIKTESKGAIIGADDMDYIGRATSIKLVKNVKGTNTLTFQMPTKFFDSKVGDFVKNEFIDDLYNERKLKLKYKDKWYEFYIKKISEEKKFKAIMKTFTCEDSFIDELSRTGYDIEFSPELNNSVEEIGTFTEEVLEDSIWDYRPDLNIGDFTEFTEERFYKIPLSQFGGSIKGYPIDLEVKTKDLKKNSNYYQNLVKDQDFTFEDIDLEKENQIKNVITKESRTLQYGDDMARVKEIFWDSYYKDNGGALLDDKNLVSLSSDYIYVPITDLSVIMGGIYNNAKKAVEEPALYGPYDRNNPQGEKGYALQPSSQNPADLIQFICFNNKDEVLIDEVGVLANNNYHYVIKIEQWNELLKQRFEENYSGGDKGLIHWTSPSHEGDKNFDLTTKYETTFDGSANLLYTRNVIPSTRTIDDFQWYPVYYEGYLSNINDVEVGMARNISISDRTELNKEFDSYVTVYKEKDSDYLDLYSEEELNNLIKRRIELEKEPELSEEQKAEYEKIKEEFRVCSNLSTRLILPSLARNLVENGTEITDETGWEAKTQNNNQQIGLESGSFYKLLEIKAKSTLKQNDDESSDFGSDIEDLELNGTTDDEKISDFYLEILSPYIEKSEDLSLEGQVETDYALNFGFIGQEKKIEKDKVYAIRIQTGTWITDNYQINYRGNYSEIESESDGGLNEMEVKKNKCEKAYRDFKTLMDCFYDGNLDYNKLSMFSGVKDKINRLFDLFNKIVLPEDKTVDPKHDEKLEYVEPSLLSILAGDKISNGDVTICGETVERTTTLEDGRTEVTYEFSTQIEKVIFNDSLIGIHDSLVTDECEKWFNLFIFPVASDGSEEVSEVTFNNSDMKYFKAAWLARKRQYGDYSVGSFLGDKFFVYSRLTSDTVDSWIDSSIEKQQHFEKRNNVDLDKIVIGNGSVNLQGNYIVDGIDNDNGDFISFSEIADIQDTKLVFVPDVLKIEGKEDKDFLTQPIFYTKDAGKIRDERWSWSEESKENSVEDNCYLLFKAKKTIENPYVAIKVESAPAQVNFDEINVNQYSRNSGAGIKIQVILPDGNEADINLNELIREGYVFVDGCDIQVVPVTKNNFSEAFLKSINYDETNQTANFEKVVHENDTNSDEDDTNSDEAQVDEEQTEEQEEVDDDREFGQLKTGDLKAQKASWKGKSMVETPFQFSAVGIIEQNAEKSYPYAIFINQIYYGIFWLEAINKKENSEETKDEENKEEGGES